MEATDKTSGIVLEIFAVFSFILSHISICIAL